MISALPDKKIINILVIDDDEDDFFIISDYIKNISNGYTFNIEWCPVYKDALVEIRKHKHDIYFVDFRLGAYTGLDLIREAIAANCEEPMILLTGRGNYEIDILVTQAGAADYLVKSELNTEKLERCIRYALGRYQFIKALKANEQKFRSIFEKSGDCIFTADEQLNFKDVNGATSALCGYTKEELLQLSLYSLLVNKDDQATIENELMLKGELSDKELDLLTKTKSVVNCIVSVSRQKNVEGYFYIQGIIHDITDLKKSAQATLQTEKLKATERLVRTLAHEIRNPLNNIYLSVDQLEPDIMEGDPKTYLDIISRNSKRIGDLLTELLNSSLPTEIILQKISLQSVLDASIAAAMDRITLKEIKLHINYETPESLVMADAGKLKIAFLNIIINAIEAMTGHAGNISIEIKSEGAFYTVSISDNGPGISEENIVKLFEPYYTSKRNGLGLGLASTLNIIESHKANIKVQSKLNYGTTFIITFQKAG